VPDASTGVAGAEALYVPLELLLVVRNELALICQLHFDIARAANFADCHGCGLVAEVFFGYLQAV
jgi:hypothetical protein